MNNIVKLIKITDSAVNKVKTLITENKNESMRLRIYITGGGCNGFQYEFTLDNKINKGDYIIHKKSIEFIIDPMSFQYLIGGCIDYIEELKGSRFVVTNPNAKTLCSCGLSFSI